MMRVELTVDQARIVADMLHWAADMEDGNANDLDHWADGGGEIAADNPAAMRAAAADLRRRASAARAIADNIDSRLFARRGR